MELHPKTFQLLIPSGTPIKPTDELVLVVNEITKNIPVKDVFIDYKQGEDFVRGCSILSEFAVNEKGLIEKDGLSVFFKNKTTDESFLITEIRYPTLWEEKEVADEIIAAQQAILVSHLEPEQVVEPPAPEVVEPVAPPVVEETPIPEPEPEPVKVLGGPEYPEQRELLIEDGYKELAHKDYRIFYNAKDSDPFLVVLLKEDDFDELDVEKLKIPEGKEQYVFRNGDEVVLAEINSAGEITLTENPVLATE